MRRLIKSGYRKLNQETQNTYYCQKCNIQHRRNSPIGKAHYISPIPRMSQACIDYALKHNVEPEVK